MQPNENSKYPADNRGITCKKQYGVMGHPIAHSKSPQIHHLFAEQAQITLEYQAILVPLDAFPFAVKTFQANGGNGLNITQPFKEQAYQIADDLTPRAKQAKAVNTLRMESNGMLYGDNTDGIGLVRDLKQNHNITLSGKRILLLGAGGAARGILGPLLEEQPSQLVIANRTIAKAQALIREFPTGVSMCAVSFSDLHQDIFDLIIHATSASHGQDNFILPSGIFASHSVGYDLTYSEDNTPFQQAVKEQNGIYINGLGMLVEQAAEAFFVWHHVRPDTQSVLNKIRQQQKSNS